MKKFAMLLLCILTVNIAAAQKKAIKITKETNGKERIIKENKRIQVFTEDGEMHSGRFQVVDDQTISIDGVSIAMANIIKIKRNSLLLRIFTSTGLIYAGGILTGFGALIGVFGSS